MQQRKKIYKKALELISNRSYFWICVAISSQIRGEEANYMKVEKFPEFMVFKPDNLDARHSWFDSKLEREICLDFCILFCDDKMFKDA